MTVYLDIIFLENLCINCIILMATSIIIKKEINLIRIILSSLVGSIYAIIVYLSVSAVFSNIALKFLLSVCMVHIAFNPKSFKYLLKQLLIFYLTSFTFGGVAFALLYFIKPQNILIKNGVFIGTYPIKIILAGVIIGFVIITVAFKLFKKKISKKDIFCNIYINFQNKQKKIKAMIDTGNLLKEPLTGNQVIVVEKNSLLDLIPEEILNNAKKIILGESDIDFERFMPNFRVIPFTSLGKENGLLLGIKIDNAQIEYDEQEYYIDNAVIGIYDKLLTKNNAYNALVGIGIFEDSKSNKRTFAMSVAEY